MLSLNLENRILELAKRRGLLKAADICEYGSRTAWEFGESECSTIWGPRLDGLVEAGKISQSTVDSLALELTDPMIEDTVGSWLGDSADLKSQSEFRLPALEPRYQTLEWVGAGATAQVFKAFDSQLQRWVALKFLKPGITRPLETALREARAQAQVEHPNVCQIYEVGEMEGQPFLAMQWADGPSLTSVFKHLELSEIVRLLCDIADGVHAAHQQGLIHLDIKLGNILLKTLPTGDFQPLITDFGMVRSELDAHLNLCPLGTPPYSSPEQIKGEFSQVDCRSDVYSLGVVLYVLMTGSFPFDADKFPKLLEAIRNLDPIPMRHRKPAIPLDLDAIVLKCLRKEPAQRYESAQALAEDLKRYLGGMPVCARPHTLPSRIRRWILQHRKWMLVSMVGFLAGISLAVWLGFRARQRVDWMRNISSGYPVKFIMHTPNKAKGIPKPFGDIQPDQAYTLVYHRGKYTVTGYHIGQGGVRTMAYANADIKNRCLSLWGQNYYFTQDGYLIDPVYGRVGVLKAEPNKLDALLSGKPFKITFDLCAIDDTGRTPNDPMGDILIGSIYTGYYRSSDNSFNITGFHEGKNQILTLSYNNADPKTYTISIWGRKFHFEENGYLFDGEFGLVGHISFLSEGASTGDK